MDLYRCGLKSGINFALEPEWAYFWVDLYLSFYGNLRTSKQTKIHHKSNVFNVAYQREFEQCFSLFRKCKHCIERILVQIK